MDYKEYKVDKYNMYDIMITKQKKSKNKYIIYALLKGKFIPLKLKLTKIKIPFGLENYNRKYIINAEFLKTNLGENQHKKIILIDKFMKNISKNPETLKKISVEFKLHIKGKQYVTCLREKVGCNPLLRLHTKMKGKNIVTTVCKNKEPYSILDLKGKICDVEIEFTSIWVTDWNWGFVININTIDIY